MMFRNSPRLAPSSVERLNGVCRAADLARPQAPSPYFNVIFPLSPLRELTQWTGSWTRLAISGSWPSIILPFPEMPIWLEKRDWSVMFQRGKAHPSAWDPYVAHGTLSYKVASMFIEMASIRAESKRVQAESQAVLASSAALGAAFHLQGRNPRDPFGSLNYLRWRSSPENLFSRYYS